VRYGAGLYKLRLCCCEDANVCMPSRVPVDCFVQSRGVFAIGQNIESRGTFCMTFLCCVAWEGYGVWHRGVGVSPWGIHLSYSILHAVFKRI